MALSGSQLGAVLGALTLGAIGAVALSRGDEAPAPSPRAVRPPPRWAPVLSTDGIHQASIVGCASEPGCIADVWGQDVNGVRVRVRVKGDGDGGFVDIDRGRTFEMVRDAGSVISLQDAEGGR